MELRLDWRIEPGRRMLRRRVGEFRSSLAGRRTLLQGEVLCFGSSMRVGVVVRVVELEVLRLVLFLSAS